MDTYGRFKLMQSFRSWLLIPTSTVYHTTNFSTLTSIKEMRMMNNELMETELPPEYGEIDATYHHVPLYEIWNPHISHWQATSVIDDYKVFIAYMRGEL